MGGLPERGDKRHLHPIISQAANPRICAVLDEIPWRKDSLFFRALFEYWIDQIPEGMSYKEAILNLLQHYDGDLRPEVTVSTQPRPTTIRESVHPKTVENTNPFIQQGAQEPIQAPAPPQNEDVEPSVANLLTRNFLGL